MQRRSSLSRSETLGDFVGTYIKMVGNSQYSPSPEGKCKIGKLLEATSSTNEIPDGLKIRFLPHGPFAKCLVNSRDWPILPTLACSVGCVDLALL
jgi:hypothetical protein